MSQDLIRGPTHLVLTASVARRYYLDGMSKTDIAEEFQLSRFKVARLLQVARASGLVRIEIGHPGVLDVELSDELRHALGLKLAVVVDTSDDHQETLRELVGRAAAQLLTEIVTDADVLGLGWARSLIAMRSALTRLARCSVVQLTGALSRSDVDDSSIELVRDVARIAGGPAYCFYAPMIVPDPTTAAALRRQPEVALAMERFSSVTKAVVAIGAWDPPRSTVYDAISPSERKALRRLETHADLSGVLLDVHGNAVEAPLTRRIIGIRAAQLRAIPEVVALAYGSEKESAVRATISGGYVTGLVTHSSLARALLETGT
jgi:DNA-binding transcriptional regulator LsrR (DeoR family)